MADNKSFVTAVLFSNRHPWGFPLRHVYFKGNIYDFCERSGLLRAVECAALVEESFFRRDMVKELDKVILIRQGKI